MYIATAALVVAILVTTVLVLHVRFHRWRITTANTTANMIGIVVEGVPVTVAVPASRTTDVATVLTDRLATLKKLHDDGVITQEEHDRQRAAAIDQI